MLCAITGTETAENTIPQTPISPFFMCVPHRQIVKVSVRPCGLCLLQRTGVDLSFYVDPRSTVIAFEPVRHIAHPPRSRWNRVGGWLSVVEVTEATALRGGNRRGIIRVTFFDRVRHGIIAGPTVSSVEGTTMGAFRLFAPRPNGNLPASRPRYREQPPAGLVISKFSGRYATRPRLRTILRRGSYVVFF